MTTGSSSRPLAAAAGATAQGRILVIDDDENMRSTLHEFLSLSGFEVDGAENGSAGLDLLGRETYDVVISDVLMPDVDGIHVIEWMKETCPSVPVIVMSGHATVEHALGALRLGAHDFVVKPFALDQMKRTIDNCLEKARLERENVELEQSNTRLREIERLKDDLLSTVSHEFRTPLTAMSGFLGILFDADLENLRPDQLQALQAIRDSVSRLDMLIANLLTLTECQSGDYRPTPRPTTMSQFLREFREEAAQSGRRGDFEVQFDDGAGEVPALVDRSRFPMVLQNLLDNAFKFEREPGKGEILVRVRREDSRLVLEVHDDGVGVGATLGDRLFERFTQADMTSTREHQGAGLGLAVVRGIVAAHRGDIRLVPPVLGGTSVRVELPIAPDGGKE